VGMGIPMESPVGMVWDWYEDCDESTWACEDSAEIFEWM